MKNKKVVALILTASMALGCLAGCGNETVQSPEVETQTQKESESVATESTEVVELEEKTIQIWLAGAKQQDTEKVWDAFNEMLQEYVPNTTVEFEIFPQSEYNEKFQQMLASGEAVDVAWAAGWVTGNVNEAIADDNFMALDELVAEYGQGITETLTQEVEDFHRKADGKLYYLVNWQGLASEKRGIYAIKEIAEKAGDTWIEDTEKAMDKYWNQNGTAEDMQVIFDQVALYCEAAKELDMLGAGINWNNFMNWNYGDHLDRGTGIVQKVGISRGDNSFTAVDGVASDYYKTFCENMADFYSKGYIRKDAASVDKTTLKNVSDGVIDENTYCLDFHNILSSKLEEELTTKWGVEVVCLEMENEVSLSNGESSINVIPYCADEPERAMMVMNAIYTVPELYQTLIWGIEGEHWTDNGDGTVNYTGGLTSEDTYGYNNWKMGSCINGLTTQTMTPGYYEEMRELESTAYVNPFNNFVFDSTGLEEVISALEAVKNEYEPQMNAGYNGANWQKVYDAYNAERKAAGVDKLIEAMQEQYDAYVKEHNITSFK